MVSSSDDVRQMSEERSARSHRGRRTVSRGLLRTIQQTKGQSNPPSVSGEANLQIPSTLLLKRNEGYASINLEVLFYLVLQMARLTDAAEYDAGNQAKTFSLSQVCSKKPVRLWGPGIHEAEGTDRHNGYGQNEMQQATRDRRQ
ncbi:unnamed protein product [Protopolystoma xenopodis]|uniref:Uncharacterized protein n=1 Tax=Protopolystoma xenopodis TaxID=117903 RepID=A0A3S4ZDQ1_9PLAT|nr:unnamed protein product [Protopolystoma xenopodis]